MSEKCGCELHAKYYEATDQTNYWIGGDTCKFAEALAHLKALILAQAFRSKVSDAASDFVKAHE